MATSKKVSTTAGTANSVAEILGIVETPKKVKTPKAEVKTVTRKGKVEVLDLPEEFSAETTLVETRTLGTDKGTVEVVLETPFYPSVLDSLILPEDKALYSPKDILLSASVPAATSSYAPVSNANVLDCIYENLDKAGYKIKSENFTTSKGGDRFIGNFGIEASDSEMGMMLAFRNSYDKSMSVGFAAGSQVWICSNGMVSGDLKLVRKHTGGVVKELTEKINEAMQYFETEFQRHLNFRETTKQIEVSKREMAELAGRMFIEAEILNTTQMNIVKKEINFSENFKEDTAWSIYNHATEALKTSHPHLYLNNHITLHELFEDKYEIVK